MFDKKRCISTIYELAKQKNIKIGDLEETAGVSKGYLSRINKEDSSSSPSIELLDSVSRQLGVGIDYLVNYSSDGLTPNEQFVFRFIDKLMRMTLGGKLDWVAETSAVLTAENNIKVDNPLVSLTKNYMEELDLWYDCHVYRSGIFDEGSADVSGTCYHASISGGSAVYLNRVTYTIRKPGDRYGLDEYKSDIVEVYLVNGGVQPICSTFYVAEELKNSILNLYMAVASAPSKIALSCDTKSIMSDFIDMPDELS